MELENIQVCLRLRPLNKKEKKKREKNIWRIYEGVSVMLNKSISNYLPLKKANIQNMIFNFDRCFPGTSTNEDIYNTIVRNLTHSCLNGINATIFMYGQTGSGKTFSMLGYDSKFSVSRKILKEKFKLKNVEKNKKRSNYRSRSLKSYDDVKKSGDVMSFDLKMKKKMIAEELVQGTQLENKTGLLIQALKELFEKIKKDKEKNYFVKCSYVEIYNDQIYDLLQRAENFSETLLVCEDVDKKEFYVRGVKEEIIDCWEDAVEKLKRGEINRHYARTVMNHSSSRSHTIFRIFVQSLSGHWKNTNKGKSGCSSPSIITESWLNFVDLAGSEKVSSHESLKKKGHQRIKEGKYINKSLFFLTQVIKLKSEGRKVHIPYRNSPLTKILRSSLGGNSRTVVVLTANPTFMHLEQTISTLRFGLSAKKIENSVCANVMTKNDEEAVKIMISDYEKKVNDYERERDQFRFREKSLIKRILELEKMQNGWVTKLKATQRKKFRHFARGIPTKKFEKIILDYKKTKTACFKNIGLVMLPQVNERYESLYEVFKEKKIENFRKKNPKFFDIDADSIKRLNFNEDGIYAMKALESVKRKVKGYEELKDKVLENWKKLNIEGNFRFLFKQLENIGKICKENITKVEQLINICKEEFELSSTLQKRLEILEGNSDYSKLGLKDLTSLKKLFEENLEKSKQAIYNKKASNSILNYLKNLDDSQVVAQLKTEIPNLLNFTSEDDILNTEGNSKIEDIANQNEYFIQLQSNCEKDLKSLRLLDEIRAPTEEEMLEILLENIEKSTKKNSEKISEEIDLHWEKYLEMKEKYFERILELSDKCNTETDSSDGNNFSESKEVLPKSKQLRMSWLEINKIMEKKELEEIEKKLNTTKTEDVSDYTEFDGKSICTTDISKSWFTDTNTFISEFSKKMFKTATEVGGKNKENIEKRLTPQLGKKRRKSERESAKWGYSGRKKKEISDFNFEIKEFRESQENTNSVCIEDIKPTRIPKEIKSKETIKDYRIYSKSKNSSNSSSGKKIPVVDVKNFEIDDNFEDVSSEVLDDYLTESEEEKTARTIPSKSLVDTHRIRKDQQEETKKIVNGVRRIFSSQNKEIGGKMEPDSHPVFDSVFVKKKNKQRRSRALRHGRKYHTSRKI